MSRSLRERQIKELEKLVEEQKKEEQRKKESEEDILPQPDPITMEVGYGLIPYVDETQGGEIPQRIRTIRSHKGQPQAPAQPIQDTHKGHRG